MILFLQLKMTELRQLLTDLAVHTNGLIGIVLSDKDGVPVLKAPIENNSAVLDGCLRHQFLSICGTLSEHARKMCLGAPMSVTATFDDHQVIHCYHESLILTLVANDQACTGQLLSFADSIKPLLSDICKNLCLNIE